MTWVNKRCAAVVFKWALTTHCEGCSLSHDLHQCLNEFPVNLTDTNSQSQMAQFLEMLSTKWANWINAKKQEKKKKNKLLSVNKCQRWHITHITHLQWQILARQWCSDVHLCMSIKRVKKGHIEKNTILRARIVTKFGQFGRKLVSDLIWRPDNLADLSLIGCWSHWFWTTFFPGNLYRQGATNNVPNKVSDY